MTGRPIYKALVLVDNIVETMTLKDAGECPESLKVVVVTKPDGREVWVAHPHGEDVNDYVEEGEPLGLLSTRKTNAILTVYNTRDPDHRKLVKSIKVEYGRSKRPKHD